MKSGFDIWTEDEDVVERASTDQGNQSEASLGELILVWAFVVLVFLTVLVVGLVNKGDGTTDPLHEETGSGNLLDNSISN